MKKIEQEIKIQCDEFQSVLQALHRCGAVFVGKYFERTERFDTSDRALEKKGIFLRTRTGSQTVITMKEKLQSVHMKRRSETEFEIGSATEMGYILRHLGFTSVRIMEKYRATFRIFRNTTIEIDELPFGLFIEIEGSKKTIFMARKKLGLMGSPVLTCTYWDIFDKNKQHPHSRNDILFPKKYHFQLKGLQI